MISLRDVSMSNKIKRIYMRPSHNKIILDFDHFKLTKRHREGYNRHEVLLGRVNWSQIIVSLRYCLRESNNMAVTFHIWHIHTKNCVTVVFGYCHIYCQDAESVNWSDSEILLECFKINEGLRSKGNYVPRCCVIPKYFHSHRSQNAGLLQTVRSASVLLLFLSVTRSNVILYVSYIHYI